eukprot:jgi/Botrbrau1/7808/Bobra.0159s0236.1
MNSAAHENSNAGVLLFRFPVPPDGSTVRLFCNFYATRFFSMSAFLWLFFVPPDGTTFGLLFGISVTPDYSTFQPVFLTVPPRADSIVATACWLFLLHLFTQDYHFLEGVTESLAGSVSLGSAVLASVLLASRLQTPQHVLIQVLFSLQLFLLGPYMRRYIKQVSWRAHVVLTGVMIGGAAALLFAVSAGLALVYLLVDVGVLLLFPLWLLKAHKFKAKINGPWDEATPSMHLRIEGL